VEYLRALSDAELDRQGSFGPGGGSTVTVERLAGLLSRHPLTHIAHVRNALNLA